MQVKDLILEYRNQRYFKKNVKKLESIFKGSFRVVLLFNKK